jgi:SAM-dependent methyltransferase
MDIDFGCPCCIAPAILYTCVFIYVASFLISKLPLHKNLKVGLKWISYLTAALVIAFAVLMAMLERDPELRSWFFAKLCSAMSKSPAINEKRCGLLAGVRGVVVEIGTGPGTNFKCWGNDTSSTLAAGNSIDTYIGVEPNRNFASMIRGEKKRTALPFQVNVMYQSGVSMPDVANASVDAVVGTHLLCSVGDVDAILREIYRILKPGGKYYLLEHVRARDENSWLYLAQRAVAPIFRVVGNGCEFTALWKNFNAHSALFDFNVQDWNAPMPIPVLRPHLVGYATRRGEAGSLAL